MEGFTPGSAAFGGVLIGLAAAMLMLLVVRRQRLSPTHCVGVAPLGMLLLAGSFVRRFTFGIGLLVSDMASPAKVLAFLDIFGNWDPSLAIVMACALAVTGAGYALARYRATPLLADKSYWPANKVIDSRLIAGATLFGVGWGLVGLCPGPALVNLATLSPHLLVFVVAIFVGMTARDYLQLQRLARELREQTQPRADG